MGKAILYFMLFVCITLLMIGCGMLLAGFIVSQGLYDHVGIAKNEVVIFVVMLMGVLCTMVTDLFLGEILVPLAVFRSLP